MKTNYTETMERVLETVLICIAFIGGITLGILPVFVWLDVLPVLENIGAGAIGIAGLATSVIAAVACFSVGVWACGMKKRKNTVETAYSRLFESYSKLYREFLNRTTPRFNDNTEHLEEIAETSKSRKKTSANKDITIV